MTAPLRVIVADDERPARSFLTALLRSFEDVTVVGEAASGSDAVALIERQKPDLALLDWQMPEMDGFNVARVLGRGDGPLIVFVTAYDEYAARAFEVNAVDYLLKPVQKARLREALNRAHEWAERADLATTGSADPGPSSEAGAATRRACLERIPVRRRDEVVIVPVNQIAYISADGDLLHLVTIKGEQHTITYRLKDLEQRLNPKQFVRLARGTLANIDLITRISIMPGGTHIAVLSNGQKLQVSRLHSRVLRTRLLKL